MCLPRGAVGNAHVCFHMRTGSVRTCTTVWKRNRKYPLAMSSGNEITIADHNRVTLIVCERLVPGKMAIFRSVLGACTRKPPRYSHRDTSDGRETVCR